MVAARMLEMDLTYLADRHEDKPAIIMGDDGSVLTYRQLESRSNQIAHLFYDLGLRPGDHVAVLMRNQLEFFPVVWAAQRSGLFYTPVNWHLSAEESTYIVENSGARVLVYDSSVHDLAVAASSSPTLERSFVVGERVDGVDLLDDAVDGLPQTPLSGAVEGYYMLYSSGTTGRPKGILPELTGAPFGSGLPIDSLMKSAFGFSDRSVYLSPAPLYHASPTGWTMGTVRNGGTAVIMERFDAEAALALIERYGVTVGQFVPTMFVRMLKLPPAVRRGYDISSVDVVVHAAAPCPIPVKEQMIAWFGPKLLEYYAGSEGNGFFMIDSEDWSRHKGSVGRAVRGTVHICDEEGCELPPGEVGTVWFGDTNRFRYHNDPVKTASAYDERGWSTLGDLGYVDEAGYLYLSARRSDLIISGGVNIYPREIEDLLILHPAILDVAVIGAPDDEMGQRVHAVVELQAGYSPSDELERELIDYARQRIAHYKAPRSMSFETVPRLPSGKILTRALLARYEPS